MTVSAAEVEPLLRALVAIPSVNPRDGEGDGGESAVARWVLDWLARRGIRAALHEVLPGRCNVVAVVPGREASAVLLESHLDTVETDGMTVGPYDGRVRDGRLYGRGACDAKGPLAAFMLAAAELAEGEPPLHTVVLAGVCDEEHAYRGVLRLLADLEDLEDLPGVGTFVGAIVGEPTDLVPATAHKGVVRYTVRTTGRAGHSSRPAEAVNAVSLMAPVIAHLETTAPPPPAHPLLGTATRCVTRIRGGTGPNTVPGSCEVDVDRRTLPGEDPMEVWRQDRAELTALGGAPVAVDEPFTVDYALDTPPGSPVVAALCQALTDEGRPGAVQGMPFGTDASKLARAGIPSVVFGPGSVTDAHSADESVALTDVALAARTITTTVRRLTQHIPGTTVAGTTDPGTTIPGATVPGTTTPGATVPGTTNPGTTIPGATDPATTDPATTTPGTTGPATTTPGTTDPATTTPGTTDPATTTPGTTDPATTTPAPDAPARRESERPCD
ncbi:M20 family metallopeptidase [Streptomyces sp. NPDC050619]|uniref:M20 family metallopeptidase n=1 Tax=Streptomyces sp. NPDC050619 TaxID=3157214 RepID=UPI0034246F98